MSRNHQLALFLLLRTYKYPPVIMHEDHFDNEQNNIFPLLVPSFPFEGWSSGCSLCGETLGGAPKPWAVIERRECAKRITSHLHG